MHRDRRDFPWPISGATSNQRARPQAKGRRSRGLHTRRHILCAPGREIKGSMFVFINFHKLRFI